MSKRRVRRRSKLSWFALYKRNIFIGLGVLFGVAIVYSITLMIPKSSPSPIPKEVTLDSVKKDTIAPVVKPIERVRKVQVEILNGCGTPKITGLFKEFFKRQDIDIIGAANYKDFNQQKSFILYHSDDVKTLAEELAEELNISEQFVKRSIAAMPTHELTLVLGFDYAKLKR